jgi:hypothetical protein
MFSNLFTEGVLIFSSVELTVLFHTPFSSKELVANRRGITSTDNELPFPSAYTKLLFSGLDIRLYFSCLHHLFFSRN